MNAPSQKLHLLPDYREDPIAQHVVAMLSHLGEDVGREGLLETPKRYAKAIGVVVVAEARHMCMAMRGVQKQQSSTTTRALRGVYAQDAGARLDVLSMIKGG